MPSTAWHCSQRDIEERKLVTLSVPTRSCPLPHLLCRSIMLFMAVTSTGSAELIAVSSLFSYDLYR